MNRSSLALPLLGVMAIAACDAPGFAPEWNVDLFFPIRFADVVLQDELPFGVLPPVATQFQTPTSTENLDAIGDVFEEDLESVEAEIIFATTVPIQGTMEISVARNTFDLFSTDPARALTTTIPLRQTSGDTVLVLPSPDLFAGATQLVTQSRGTVQSATGGVIGLNQNDVLFIGVDLTVTVRAVKN